MSMADMLNIKLYNDNVKQFNQAWDTKLLSLDKRVDEEKREH